MMSSRISFFGNAFNFSKEPVVNVNIKIDGNELVIEVIDNGKGFNVNALSGPFSRSQTGNTETASLKYGHNLGLGLSFVEGVADASNGSFVINSTSQGTTAVLRIKL